MIDKIVYDNGRIRSGGYTFECDDETDIEVLCDRVNETILTLKIENAARNNQIKLIKEVLELKE